MRGAEQKADGETTLVELGFTFEILGEANVGSGGVAWAAIDPRVEALATPSISARRISIEETGEVPELEIVNPSDEEALVLAHSVLAGGLQTRATERSVVVPPNARVRVPVHCVEQGRWRAKDGGDRGFVVSLRTGVGARFAASDSMARGLAASGRFTAEQAAMWRHVDAEIERTRVVTSTKSYEAVIEDRKKKQLELARAASVSPPPRANALVVFPRGGGFWLEGFASSAALAEQSDELLAELFDMTADEDVEPPSRVAAADLFAAIFEEKIVEIEGVPGTTGRSFAFVGRDRGALVTMRGALAHVALGAAPPDRPVAAHASGVVSRPRASADVVADAFAKVERLRRGDPPSAKDVAGYRLVRVLGNDLTWVDVRANGDGYAVIGSHERCDVALPNDADVWLRHVVAVCSDGEGGLGLRLIDLKTDQPFFLSAPGEPSDDDREPRRSVFVQGTFAMRLGGHVVVGMPLPREGGDERRRSEPPQIARPQDGSPYRQRPTTITSLGPVSQIQELAGAPSVLPTHVRVTLESATGGASVELPIEALDSGVLLGRATNCFDGGLKRVFCEAISRAHLLLLREGGEAFAFDLATTNGTRVAGKRVRRVLLPDAGATIDLARKITVRWHRRRGA